MSDIVLAWASAIAQFEGFNTPGSIAALNHNPGNLKYAGQAGTVGKDLRGFAIFSDDPAGWQALYNQLAKYVRSFPGYSLLQITAHYLGQSVPTVDTEGNAFTYANFVAGRLGVAVTVTLADLVSGLTNQAPADQAPANQVPSDQVPAEQVPADQVPADQVPADQAEVDSQGTSPDGGSGVLLAILAGAFFLLVLRR